MLSSMFSKCSSCKLLPKLSKIFTELFSSYISILRPSLDIVLSPQPNSIPFGAVSGTAKARLRFRHCTQLI